MWEPRRNYPAAFEALIFQKKIVKNEDLPAALKKLFAVVLLSSKIGIQ